MNDIIGKSGVEEAFESQLRGQNGKRTITLNSNGEVIDAAVTEPAGSRQLYHAHPGH